VRLRKDKILMAIKPIPEGYHTITPYISVKGADEFIKMVGKAFGGKEVYRMSYDDGRVMHAEVKIGDSHIMLNESTVKNPPSNILFNLYVENVDEVFKKAVDAGCTSLQEPTLQFYGDKAGGVKDKFGIQWWISTHVEDVSPEEMKKREEEMKKKQK
jgi:PhnB protein